MALPLCLRVQKVIRKIVFVQLQSNAGVLNSVDPSTTLNQAWLTALINNTDKSLRWFPTPTIMNIDTPKDAPVFEKYKSDESNFVRESVRKFKGLIPNCPPMFKGKVESVRCNNNTGVYLIDIEGNLIGLNAGNDNLLYPIPINAQSLVGNVVFANDDNTTAIDLNFEFPAKIQDAQFYMIDGNSFPDFDMTAITGLLDIKAAIVGSVTDTSFQVQLTTPSPDLAGPIPVQGALTANFVGHTGTAGKIYNITDTADDTVTVVESTVTPGLYTGSYSSIVAKTLQLAIKYPGFDASALGNGPIVTP